MNDHFAPSSRPRFAFASALTLATALVAGCGGLAPCPVPTTRALAVELLEGRWAVTAWNGEDAGELTFSGNSLEVHASDVSLFGTWSLVESGPNAHRVLLRIGGAMEGGVRQEYGVFDEVELTLVFGDSERVYALQSEGTWTSWDRLAVPSFVAPPAEIE